MLRNLAEGASDPSPASSCENSAEDGTRLNPEVEAPHETPGGEAPRDTTAGKATRETTTEEVVQEISPGETTCERTAGGAQSGMKDGEATAKDATRENTAWEATSGSEASNCAAALGADVKADTLPPPHTQVQETHSFVFVSPRAVCLQSL